MLLYFKLMKRLILIFFFYIFVVTDTFANENYVLSKQFQNDIVSGARKNSDVREYPLGGVERLIQMISKFVKVPSSMIGIGNGSDQILDLILSNFASKQNTSKIHQEVK